MRLFVALDLPAALKLTLARLQEDGRRSGISASWPDPEALHLTLAFLGEQPDARLPTVHSALRRAAACQGPFALRTAGLGGFPSPHRARVLTLELEPCVALTALAQGTRQALVAADIVFDPKPFAPHVTLARLRVPGPAGGLGLEPRPLSFAVEDMVLFESHLQRGGARHEVLGRFPLAGPAGEGRAPGEGPNAGTAGRRDLL